MMGVIATGPVADMGWAIKHICEVGTWYRIKFDREIYTIEDGEADG